MLPTINGLQDLISLPCGCGEQTMLKFAPDVYILKYLTAIGKMDETTSKKGKENLQKGTNSIHF